jgi:hypothetical protein
MRKVIMIVVWVATLWAGVWLGSTRHTWKFSGSSMGQAFPVGAMPITMTLQNGDVFKPPFVCPKFTVLTCVNEIPDYIMAGATLCVPAITPRTSGLGQRLASGAVLAKADETYQTVIDNRKTRP